MGRTACTEPQCLYKGNFIFTETADVNKQYTVFEVRSSYWLLNLE